MWIKREITESVLAGNEPIQIIRGPRQCGKSSLIGRISPDYAEVSFDDPTLRLLADSDPQALLSQYEGKKLFIDEAQHAPKLFPLLKRRIDLYKRGTTKTETQIRMTGSNQILMDKNIKESLAGRAGYYDLNTLSVSEIQAAIQIPVQTILFRGGWPDLYARPDIDPKKFLDDYISSYVEKDIILAAGIQKQREFLLFCKLLAGRVGQLVDFSSLAKDAGVDGKTAKDWISVLERMAIIVLVQPFFSNQSKRLVKAPKVFFLDTGLACRLQGWTAPEPIFTSPMQGHLFENLVFSELYKLSKNLQKGWEIFHWRSRDGEEIDFIIQRSPDDYLFLEAKISFQAPRDVATFPEVRKVFKSKPPPLYYCIMNGDRVVQNNIPIALLKDTLNVR